MYGALNNASWTGAALQIALVALNLVIWYPFFKRADTMNVKAEVEAGDAHTA